MPVHCFPIFPLFSVDSYHTQDSPVSCIHRVFVNLCPFKISPLPNAAVQKGVPVGTPSKVENPLIQEVHYYPNHQVKTKNNTFVVGLNTSLFCSLVVNIHDTVTHSMLNLRLFFFLQLQHKIQCGFTKVCPLNASHISKSGKIQYFPIPNARQNSLLKWF